MKLPNSPAQVSATPALRTAPRTLTLGGEGADPRQTAVPLGLLEVGEPFQEGFLEEALPWMDLEGWRRQKERRAVGRGAEADPPKSSGHEVVTACCRGRRFNLKTRGGGQTFVARGRSGRLGEDGPERSGLTGAGGELDCKLYRRFLHLQQAGAAVS